MVLFRNQGLAFHADEFKGAPSGKRVAKKILAKSGDAAFQYEILKVRNWEHMREPDEPPRTRKVKGWKKNMVFVYKFPEVGLLTNPFLEWPK